MHSLLSRLFTLGLLWVSTTCAGQGILIPIDPVPLPRPILVPARPAPVQSYKIKELSVDTRIQDQIARVQLTQVFVNTGSATMEVTFCFPLPYDGAIDQMTFMVDGKEFEAKLLPAEKAKEIYLSHVRRNQDPALLEWIGTGMFQTSIFPVPPGAERTVAISMTQLLRQSDRMTDFLYPLSTARYTSQPIDRLSLTTSIYSTSKLKSVYSPTHAVSVQRPDEHRARVTFEAKNVVPTNDFRLMFDSADTEVGASLISYRPDSSQDGYFLLMASPEVKAPQTPPLSKTVVFVVDRSGSMTGKKIDQAREALKFVLNNLREGDLFNIVAYDNKVESFRPELQRYEVEERAAAIGWVDSLYAGGSTNIGSALTTALQMIQDAHAPSYIVFLTDGLPTAGETNEMKIAETVRSENRHQTRLISFGVGYDVNSRLLDRLSRDNHGVSEFVRPDEDIEQHVSRLYTRISAPVMTDVQMSVSLEQSPNGETPVTNRVYPQKLTDLFAGQQLLIIGRYRSSGDAQITISGRSGDSPIQLNFPAKLVEVSSDQSYAFVESLWAIRRVGEIIDELDLSGSNRELIDELVSLSTKYGIVTPYTSFLADDTAPLAQLSDSTANSALATNLVADQLSQAEGQFGFEQRAAKKLMRESNQVARGNSLLPSGTMPIAPGSANTAGNLGYPNATSPQSSVAQTDSNSANAIRIVGNATLYRRGQVWVSENAKDFDKPGNRDSIQVIERFSDRYFQLVAQNDSAENAVLASQLDGEELVVVLRGSYYRIR